MKDENGKPLTYWGGLSEKNKTKTAVEWLEKELKERYSLINSEPLFEQAKKREKEQIMTAYSINLPIEDGVVIAVQKAKQYYNRIFTNE